MQNTLLDKIEQAELILVGIGEEFNDMKQLRQIKGYTEAQECVKASENAWLLPALNAFYEKKMESAVNSSLNKLAELLKNKNYFVVSVATNDKIAEAAWKEGAIGNALWFRRKKTVRRWV